MDLMTTVIVNVVEKHGRRGGKLYPARLPTEAERNRMVTLAHQMHCQRGYSIRETQRRLQEYGIVRSRGQVHNYLRNFECPRCAEPEPAPESSTRAAQHEPDRQPRQQASSGLLTSSLLEDGR